MTQVLSVMYDRQVNRNGNITLAVETSLGFFLGRELGDPIVVIAEEVEGEVAHVLLCRTSSVVYSSMGFKIPLTRKQVHAEGLERKHSVDILVLPHEDHSLHPCKTARTPSGP